MLKRIKYSIAVKYILVLPFWVRLGSEYRNFLVYEVLAPGKEESMSTYTFGGIEQSSLALGQPLHLGTFGRSDIRGCGAYIIAGRGKSRVGACDLGPQSVLDRLRLCLQYISVSVVKV